MPVDVQIGVDAVKPAEKIEMPPGAAEFAVGGELQTDLLLLGDDLLDLAVLDGLKCGGVDLGLGEFGARLLQRRGAQKTADVVGAKGRRGADHWI